MAQNTNNKTQGSRFYYKIIEGEFRRKALATDENTVKRTTKDGTEVEEFKADSLSGDLVSFELVTQEYQGKKMTDLVVTLHDIGETYIIQIPVESRYFQSFVNKLPNMDFSEPVNLMAYKFTPKDKVKPVSGIAIKQDGHKIEDYYNKNNPLPGVPEFPANGDDSEKKMWGLQQTIALKKLLTEQQGRFADAKEGNTFAQEPANTKAEDLGDSAPLPF
jgi:hypothetical protein